VRLEISLLRLKHPSVDRRCVPKLVFAILAHAHQIIATQHVNVTIAFLKYIARRERLHELDECAHRPLFIQDRLEVEDRILAPTLSCKFELTNEVLRCTLNHRASRMDARNATKVGNKRTERSVPYLSACLDEFRERRPLVRGLKQNAQMVGHK
jgi:hypothetical protein